MGAVFLLKESAEFEKSFWDSYRYYIDINYFQSQQIDERSYGSLILEKHRE